MLARLLDSATGKESFLVKNPVVGTILLATVGGSIPTLIKYALDGLGPWTVLAIRFISATIFLLPLVPTEYKNFEVAKELKFISIAGFCNPLFIALALVTISASVGPPAYAATPLLLYVVGVIRGERVLEATKVVGLLGGIAGVGLIVLTDETIRLSPTGLLFLALGVVSFSTFLYLTQITEAAQRIPAIARAFHFCLLSAIASATVAGYELLSDGLSSELKAAHILAVLAVGIVGTGWQYTFMQSMVEYQSGATTALFTMAQPVIGVLVAVALLSEPLTWPLAVGVGLVLIAVHLMTKTKR